MIGSRASRSPLEEVGDAHDDSALGDMLTDQVLTEMGYEGLGQWDECEPYLPGGALRGRGWLGLRLGPGDRLGGTLPQAWVGLFETPPSKSGVVTWWQEPQQMRGRSDMVAPGAKASLDHTDGWSDLSPGGASRGCQ
jgi:hypothetical protein